jgi:hypothetical protein
MKEFFLKIQEIAQRDRQSLQTKERPKLTYMTEIMKSENEKSSRF